MRIRFHTFQLIAALVVCITVSDVAFAAVFAEAENGSFFLCESESEESAEDHIPEWISDCELSGPLSSLHSQEKSVSVVFQLSEKANLSPHGWKVPVFLDDCAFRL